jgi:ABC-type antimicrobial peptide transport system ATPase subunit
MSDRILVMKEGILVEQGFADEVFSNPLSDHTKALIDSTLD